MTLSKPIAVWWYLDYQSDDDPPHLWSSFEQGHARSLIPSVGELVTKSKHTRPVIQRLWFEDTVHIILRGETNEALAEGLA